MTKVIEIVELAFSKNEIGELLCGAPRYAYRDRWSPAPASDITSIMGGIYQYAKAHPEEDVGGRIQRTCEEICKVNIGIVTTASVLLYESNHQNMRKDSPLNLDLDYLAGLLMRAIQLRRTELRSDRSIETGGDLHKDGTLGDLRRLSKNVTSCDGPGFFPEEGE